VPGKEEAAMTTPRHGRFRRAVRGFTLGSGPLKRRSDRLQMVARVVVALAVATAPALAVAAATATTANLESVAATEAAERHASRALVLHDAPARTDREHAEYPPVVTVATTGQWIAPDGAVHQGPVRVPPGTQAGTSVPVWVGSDGELTSAPLRRQSIEGSAMAMGALVLGGVPVAVWTLYFFLCFALDVRRERDWEKGWAAVEPVWGTRLQ
jgi:hypothetical protein